MLIKDHKWKTNKWLIVLQVFLHWTWGLTQTLLGLFVFIATSWWCKHYWNHGNVFTVIKLKKPWGGFSLGFFTFGDYAHEDKDGKLIESELSEHEYGHTLQSILLGPVDLFVIEIPSMMWYWFFDGYRKKHSVSYYDLYCERWADKWGGVPYRGFKTKPYEL